jgi:hypothetical protein
VIILNRGRARGTIVAVSLAAVVALLIAVVFTAGVADAKGGRGGGGGGGGGKPSLLSKARGDQRSRTA